MVEKRFGVCFICRIIKSVRWSLLKAMINDKILLLKNFWSKTADSVEMKLFLGMECCRLVWIKALKNLWTASTQMFCVQEQKCNRRSLFFLDMSTGTAEKVFQYGCFQSRFCIVTYGLGIEEHDKKAITAEYKEFYLVNVYTPNSQRPTVGLQTDMGRCISWLSVEAW